ncbi:uncharacterized protein LOC132048955 [Lycium ferocissimum]|uniref:uncharacterized protein LOC132048955 n=1 Tax=Lycium ferocissimum TaxID=112874 RepID=UPI0028149A11|nr:uncharacterized protein LOC132048955 [Lycium ferocissimum]
MEGGSKQLQFVEICNGCYRVQHSVQISYCCPWVMLILSWGVRWLNTLGRILFDFRNRTIEFMYQGLEDDLQCHNIQATQGESLTPAIAVLIKQYASIFEPPTTLPPHRGSFDHRIPLMESANPVSKRPYRYPGIKKDIIEKLVQEMLDQDLLDELGGAVVFSKIDLRAGYHQLRMHEDDTHKTAFKTHEGHYEFLVMPFGLTNAPSSFQSLMNSVFRPLLRKTVLVFFDDILIYSKSLSDHVGHVKVVFDWMQRYQLYAKISKCAFGVPKTLTCLLKKEGFKWSEEATLAFEKLKLALISRTVLAMPDYSKPLWWADASGKGIGLVLMQQGHPIAYIGKSLAPRHQAMSVYDRELLALVFAVIKWSHYLLGRPFTVKTDQKALKNLLEQHIHTDFQVAGISKLMAFDFSIEYKKGAENKAADALSRRHDSSYWWKGRLVVGNDPQLKQTIIGLWHNSTQGLLQPLPIPDGVWTDICMDFIEALHKSKAQSVAQSFLDHVFKLHGLPATITSDRDPIFLSTFWQELFTLQGVQLHRSTAYHPQTDGQTEVLNRTLETYLRCFCSDCPTDWSNYLPLAEWWYNTTYHTAIRCTPYEVLYGQKPHIHLPYLAGESSCEMVDRSLTAREAIILLLKFHILRAQQRMKDLADKHSPYCPNPEAVLDRRLVKRGNKAVAQVLVKWSDLDAADAT